MFLMQIKFTPCPLGGILLLLALINPLPIHKFVFIKETVFTFVPTYLFIYLKQTLTITIKES